MSQVEHQPARQRFVIPLDGPDAVLEYRLAASGAVDFVRTFVPENQRGRGLAEKLVRFGLRWAREQNLEVHASCWYVGKFLRTSPAKT